jgi:diacylglycerol O-acyltransferase / wax synthase
MREAAGPPAARTSLDRLAGPGRTLAPIRGGLDQVQQIAHSHHATINDVLLAVTAGGLRGLLRSRGEPVENLVVPIYVLITLRPASLRDQARGNLTALMVVPLPVGMPGSGRRLREGLSQYRLMKAFREQFGMPPMRSRSRSGSTMPAACWKPGCQRLTPLP